MQHCNVCLNAPFAAPAAHFRPAQPRRAQRLAVSAAGGGGFGGGAGKAAVKAPSSGKKVCAASC